MKKILLMVVFLIGSQFTTEANVSFNKNCLIPTEEWRYPTQAEVDDMVNDGWLKEGDDPQNLINCQWSDGFGGQLPCNGTCRVYSTNNGATWRIGCFNGDIITGNCCERS
jgi:hypothetical protein